MSIGLHMLAALPGALLSVLAHWAKYFTGAWFPDDQIDALRRAELRARADIRAALKRLAEEFDMPDRDVEEAMAQVEDAIGVLAGEIEADLAYDIEYADQY
jgi:hypothetical protein